MDDVQIGPGDLAAGASDRPQDLLVDPPVEPQVRPVAEQLDVIDDRDVAFRLAVRPRLGTVDLHDKAEHAGIDGRARPAARSPRPHSGRDRVVGIHPEQPVAARVPQGFVAGRREIVAPGEMEQPPAERFHDPRRLVDRAGVDDDHLVDPGPDALQAGRQGPGRVAHDHAQREPRPLDVAPQPQSAPRLDFHGERPSLTRRAPMIAVPTPALLWMPIGQCGRVRLRPARRCFVRRAEIAGLSGTRRTISPGTAAGSRASAAATSTPLPTNVRPP